MVAKHFQVHCMNDLCTFEGTVWLYKKWSHLKGKWNGTCNIRVVIYNLCCHKIIRTSIQMLTNKSIVMRRSAWDTNPHQSEFNKQQFYLTDQEIAFLKFWRKVCEATKRTAYKERKEECHFIESPPWGYLHSYNIESFKVLQSVLKALPRCTLIRSRQ